MNAGFIREEEIVETIGNGIVEEGRHSEESLGYELYPFHEDFEF